MINMVMWINNPNETGRGIFLILRAAFPFNRRDAAYFGGDVTKVHAFFKRGHNRKGWSNLGR